MDVPAYFAERIPLVDARLEARRQRSPSCGASAICRPPTLRPRAVAASWSRGVDRVWRILDSFSVTLDNFFGPWTRFHILYPPSPKLAKCPGLKRLEYDRVKKNLPGRRLPGGRAGGCLGKKKKFQNLLIKVLKCENSKFDDDPEITAYIQVKDLNISDNEKVFIFNGWTFSSSPTLNPFDHPVYDLWLSSCKII